jgi:Zn-dependent peptidase ImmA (M78 family)
MYQNRKLGSDAMRLALKIRNKNGTDIKDAFCIYDLAQKMGLQLRFIINIENMEGMYFPQKKLILVNSHRPPGRQRFTCAHELGHKSHIDEIIADYTRQSNGRNPDEIKADLFASYLLMPSTTVINGFIRRGWKLEKATPLQIYTVAWWLGVGYTSLVFQLRSGIRKISDSHAESLLKQKPKQIKKEILGNYCQENVIPIDFGWSGRPIDVYENDMLVFEEKVEVEGSNLEYVSKIASGYLYKTFKTGSSDVFHHKEGWRGLVRVSRKNYDGISRYRHLED